MLVRNTITPIQHVKHNAIMPALIALTATAIAACSAGTPDIPTGLEQDPLTIVHVLTESLNDQQYDGALNLFADDVWVTTASGETYTGKSSVQSWMMGHGKRRSDLCDVWLAGNTITWTVRTDDQGTLKSQAVVRDGKIQSIKWVDSGTR